MAQSLSSSSYSSLQSGLIIPTGLNSSTSELPNDLTNESVSAASTAIPDAGRRGIEVEVLTKLIKEIPDLERRIKDLEGQIISLGELARQADDAIHAKRSLERKISCFFDRLFWVIAIPGILLTLICLIVVGCQFFTSSVCEVVVAVVGFLGLGGFVSMAGYLRKLGKMHARLADLESKFDSLGR